MFSSAPATFWWAVVTFNTIGCGDMVPLTPPGQFVAGLVSVPAVAVPAAPSFTG